MEDWAVCRLLKSQQKKEPIEDSHEDTQETYGQTN